MAPPTTGLTSNMQEAILALVCWDEKDGRAILGQLPLKFFDTYWRRVAEKAEAHWTQYGKPPGTHVIEIFDTLIANASDGDGEVLLDMRDSLCRARDTVQKPVVLGALHKFARCQNIKTTVKKVMDLRARLDKGDDNAIQEAETLFANASKPLLGLDFAAGLLLNDPGQALRFLDRHGQQAFPLGIPELDKIGFCPTRKRYMLVGGLTGTGKTWCGCHCGVRGYAQGANVAHITLEMPEEEVAKRYVQMTCAVGAYKSEHRIMHFAKDKDGNLIGQRIVRRKTKTLRDPDIRKHLRKELAPLAQRGRLYIKEYPSGQLTIRTLRGWLDRMEAVQGVRFDMLIVDYPDLMAHDPKFTRQELGKIAIDLKGIATEKNLAVVGFTQMNEAGGKRGVAGTGRSFEGRAKEHTADFYCSINQTEEEHALGLMRLHVAKARDGKKFVTVLISQDLDIGAFCADSVRSPTSDDDYLGQFEKGD